MPTYQYACTECGHQFETVQSFSDASLTECPQCTGKLRKVFNAVGIVFKGSGFYRTDSRSGSSSSSSEASGGGKDSVSKESGGSKDGAAVKDGGSSSSSGGSSTTSAGSTSTSSGSSTKGSAA